MEPDSPSVAPVGPMQFTCNICDTVVVTDQDRLDRESSSCPHCLSSVRMRAIVHALSLSLFGVSMPLPRLPDNSEIVGIGLSDWYVYADVLASKFNYKNTYYHQPPQLDITAPTSDYLSSCDFLISTDVFEHVAPPVSRAFVGAFNVLKPGGSLILTVPFTNEDQTIEHFPDLHDYKIITLSDQPYLINRARDGQLSVKDNLIFHGGPGETLEMRLFCKKDLHDHLGSAGFSEIEFLGEDVPKWGIHTPGWSDPIIARKPSGVGKAGTIDAVETCR